jgi:hypothetical protein
LTALNNPPRLPTPYQTRVQAESDAVSDSEEGEAPKHCARAYLAVMAEMVGRPTGLPRNGHRCE